MSWDLQDVNKQLISRLEGAGIQSISDLVTTTPYELLEGYHSNYDDAIEGIDFETISQLLCSLFVDKIAAKLTTNHIVVKYGTYINGLTVCESIG